MNHAFGKRAPHISPLSADEGNRQGRAAQAAPGSVDELRAFLNSRHEGLNGRPIERFQVGPYIYSSLPDAIAQARRGRVAGNDP